MIAQSFIIFTAIAGFSLSLLLSIVFLKRRTAPHVYLGILFLAMSFLLLEEYLWVNQVILVFPNLAEVFQGAVFIIPPALYFYTIYHINQKEVKNIWAHALPALISIINFSPLYFQTIGFKKCYVHEELFDELSNSCLNFDDDLATIFPEDFLDVILICQFVIYGIFVFRNWSSMADNKTKKASLIFKTWGKLIAILFILGALFLMLDIYVFTQSKGVFSILYMTTIIFILGYFILNQSKLLDDNLKSNSYGKKSVKEIDSSYLRVVDLLNKETKYTDQNITITDIAIDLKIPPNELSFILSEKQTNFRNLLNSIRIEKAKGMLIDKNHAHITIEGIGKQLGYKSKTTFYKHFKENTNLTPREFIDRHNM